MINVAREIASYIYIKPHESEDLFVLHAYIKALGYKYLAKIILINNLWVKKIADAYDLNSLNERAKYWSITLKKYKTKVLIKNIRCKIEEKNNSIH